MNKFYYLLLMSLVVIGIVVAGVLAKRADQTDRFFEYQKSQSGKNYEGN